MLKQSLKSYLRDELKNKQPIKCRHYKAKAGNVTCNSMSGAREKLDLTKFIIIFTVVFHMIHHRIGNF